jgi:hypothetical protein
MGEPRKDAETPRAVRRKEAPVLTGTPSFRSNSRGSRAPGNDHHSLPQRPIIARLGGCHLFAPDPLAPVSSMSSYRSKIVH